MAQHAILRFEKHKGKPGAVPAGATASLFNAALNEVVIASLRFDDMEVVFTPVCGYADYRQPGIF